MSVFFCLQIFGVWKAFTWILWTFFNFEHLLQIKRTSYAFSVMWVIYLLLVYGCMLKWIKQLTYILYIYAYYVSSLALMIGDCVPHKYATICAKFNCNFPSICQFSGWITVISVWQWLAFTYPKSITKLLSVPYTLTTTALYTSHTLYKSERVSEYLKSWIHRKACD